MRHSLYGFHFRGDAEEEDGSHREKRENRFGIEVYLVLSTAATLAALKHSNPSGSMIGLGVEP